MSRMTLLEASRQGINLAQQQWDLGQAIRSSLKEQNMSRNIIVDIDGCIAKYDFPTLTKQYFGKSIPNKGVWTYSLEDSLGVASRHIIDMFTEEVFAPPNFVQGALGALKHFISKDYNVCIHTNRLKFMEVNELEDWLNKWGIPYSSIIVNGDLPGYVHAHVDDSPKKLMYTDDNTTVKHLLLFDNPWNRQCLNITGKLHRVKTWKEIREVVNGS